MKLSEKTSKLLLIWPHRMYTQPGKKWSVASRSSLHTSIINHVVCHVHAKVTPFREVNLKVTIAFVSVAENNARFCEYKVLEMPDFSNFRNWPGGHPPPPKETRLRLPVGRNSSAKKIMKKHCVKCFNCSENGMSCTQHDV